MFEAALDAGADDVQSSESGHEVYCAPDDLSAVRDALEQRFGAGAGGASRLAAAQHVPIGEDDAETLFKLLDVLDDNDDVQRVAANFEVADDVLDRLSR